MYGHDLADDQLDAADGRDDELLERAALALARDGHRREHDHRQREDDAGEPGHDEDRGTESGLYQTSARQRWAGRLERGAQLLGAHEWISALRACVTPAPCRARWPRSAGRSRPR